MISGTGTLHSGKIRKISENHYDVKSDVTDETYYVDLKHNRCTCMDFTMRGFKNQTYTCKHIRLARGYKE